MWTWWWLVSGLATVLPSPQRPTKVASTATEILYIEDGYPDHRTYKLEDFFWTGSGDGGPENPWDEDKTSTIYKTKTIMSTVYISISNDNNQTNTESPTTECTIDCQTVSVPDGPITPTPTLGNHTTQGFEHGNSTADKYFWLLTVIKTDGHEPVVAVLEKRLAKLYSVAFRRQQERHLGISKQKRSKRQSANGNNNGKFPSENKPVNVCIHTLEKAGADNEVQVLYHVLVSGRPVAATAAAADMRLVTDEEVTKELGFPITTKAEPYIKPHRPESLARVRDTWLFIGVALATIFLLLLMVTMFTFCLNKRKRSMLPVRPSGLVNRQSVFQREHGGGHDNGGYVQGPEDPTKTYQSGRRYHRKSPGRPRTNTSNETLTSKYPEGRPLSSQSSTSASTSTTSSDASPLMLPPKHRSPHTNKNKRRVQDKRASAINKTLIQKQASIGIESDSSIDKGSDITLVKGSGGKVSPKSYLSMPSVKAFPRSSIPETLNKVLEPVSVLHLDMSDDIIPEPSPILRPVSGRKLSRHGSLGAEDPGVIGPVVWDLHCKKLEDKDNKLENHTHRMRRRFHELLDDTFSLFGTSKDSPEPAERAGVNMTRNIEPRGHSATIRSTAEPSTTSRPRPKTSDPRRVAPSPGLEPPRGAWASGTPSPLVRPLSAAPTVDMQRVLADGALNPSDPAVPLIQAIKTELGRCSLPGSTNNLADS